MSIRSDLMCLHSGCWLASPLQSAIYSKLLIWLDKVKVAYIVPYVCLHPKYIAEILHNYDIQLHEARFGLMDNSCKGLHTLLVSAKIWFCVQNRCIQNKVSQAEFPEINPAPTRLGCFPTYFAHIPQALLNQRVLKFLPHLGSNQYSVLFGVCTSNVSYSWTFQLHPKICFHFIKIVC